jgi:hypothetical protein
MGYRVTYTERSDTNEATHNSVQYLNESEETSELQAIIDHCTALEVDAQLFDEAGFRKGWVHADGNYRLQ